MTLPVRTGKVVPESAGASLVVVYRDPSPNVLTNPLRKIVIYGGITHQAGREHSRST